jgi:hypothetical protein
MQVFLSLTVEAWRGMTDDLISWRLRREISDWREKVRLGMIRCPV